MSPALIRVVEKEKISKYPATDDSAAFLKSFPPTLLKKNDWNGFKVSFVTKLLSL